MIELLESRISPAALVGNVLTYTDLDGDLVKMVFTKATMVAGDFHFNTGGVDGLTTTPQSLTSLSMTGHAGAGFTLTAKQQGGKGDGHANIGTITSTNTPLGKISIDGDLAVGTFTSGTGTTAAVQSLTVNTLGANATTSSAQVEFQGLGSLTVKTDFLNTKVILDASSIVTKSIIIGGDVLGSSLASSANLTANATVTAVKIGGSIYGGTVGDSGELKFLAAGLKSLTIGGSILTGGDGSFGNGSVNVLVGDPALTIKIGGSITGTFGYGSAKSVTVVGAVVGSQFDSSGVLFGGALGTLSIGAVVGGSSPYSGNIFNSGYVKIDGNVGTIKIPGGISAGQDVGTGTEGTDGMLAVDGTVGTAVIGSLVGNANNLARISVRGSVGFNAIKTLTITHSVTYGSISAGHGSLLGAPSIDSGIGSIIIGGNLAASYIDAGSDLGPDNLPGTQDDGVVSTTATIGSVKIGGRFTGASVSPNISFIAAAVIDKVQIGAAVYNHTALLTHPKFNTIGQAELLSVS